MTEDGFYSHNILQPHKEAALRVLKIPAEYSNVSTSISEQYIFEQLKANAVKNTLKC